MSFFNNLTRLGQVVVVVAILAALFAVGHFTGLNDKLNHAGDSYAERELAANQTFDRPDNSLVIGLQPWGGYAPGLRFNNGAADNNKSRFRSLDVSVDFDIDIVGDRDYQLEKLRSGQWDGVWATVAAMNAEYRDLPPDVRGIMMINKSTGGDVMICDERVTRASDMQGKGIVTAEANPSHTLTLYGAERLGLSPSTTDIRLVDNPIQAEAAYMERESACATVWAPANKTAAQEHPGTYDVVSTEGTENLIYDVLLVREETLREKKDELVAFYTGWVISADEIERGFARQGLRASEVIETIPILTQSMGFDDDAWEETFHMAYRTNHADNRVFFGQGASGTVTGAQVLEAGYQLYKRWGYVRSRPFTFEDVFTDEIVQAAGRKYPQLNEQEAAAPATFDTLTEEEAIVANVSTSKDVTVEFDFASARLTAEGIQEIDREVVNLVRFSTERVKIVGHTDNVGSDAANMSMSRARANAVVDYLVSQGIDRNRITAVGMGETELLSGVSGTDDSNRRVEIAFIAGR